MTGGSECAAGDKDGVPTRTAQVPVGWQRKLEDGAVAYISLSGTILSSAEEVRAYLLTDSTCKCGLECPLVIHKVFNFDPVAVVRSQSQQPGKAEEDMTKLCNHRRKVVAMAALCRSMQASQLPLHGPGSSFCSMESRDQRGGPLGVRMEDGGHCTYSAQPRLSAQSKSNSSPAPRGANSSFPLSPTMTLLHNGSLPHSNALLSFEGAAVSKRPSSSSPGCNSAGYGVPPWYTRPSTPQTIIQRLPQASGSPGSSKLGTHPGGVLSLDVSLSASSSPSASALSLTMTGRPGQSHPQQQGSGVKSPSPISLCLSPSRTLDATSPHQRSRHSSASSTLSEQGSGVGVGGVSGGVAGPPGGAKQPCPARSPLPPNAVPCLSPKVPLLHPPSPRGRLEGMLQHYKDCSPGTNAPPPQHPSNQSNFQVPQNLSHFATGADRKNGPATAMAPGPGSVHGSAGAAGGFLGLPLGQLLSQQKNPQHVSSFPASSLLSAAAKAQMASQKSQALDAPAGGAASSAGPEKDPQQSKGTVSSPSAGSTSVPCAPMLPSAVPEEMNSLVPLTEQDKSNGQNPPLLPPLLPPGMMGDLTALGNISGLHSLLGAGPLLLPQVPGPALGVPLAQGQGALNPLACLINSLQLNMGPTLTVDKQLGLAEATNAPQEEDMSVSQLAQEPVPNPGHVQGTQPPPRESAAPAAALFDPYGSFMDTIYTSFLQVSGKDSEALGGGGGGPGGGSSSSNPLSFPAPDLPALLAQPSAPPSLSPRRACSVHNSDLSRLGMEAAQSPARGTPKLSEDASSTPPPGKPAGGSEGHDEAPQPPLPPAFLEEAKTDGSSSLCVYSNGLAAGTGLQGAQEEGSGGRTQPQGYLSPRANAEAAEDSAVSNDTDTGKEPAVRTGGRRGRKRKQVLERVADGPGGLDSIIEEPQVTIALPKPARSTRGKRRRVVR